MNMNCKKWVLLVATGYVLFISTGVNAEPRHVTVSFLRAAASSLSDRAEVSFDAVFEVQQGMAEPQSWNMRGRGLSRFSLKDPQSLVVFDNMYCSQDSKAFKDMVGLESNRVIHVTGYKDSGENNQASIFVTSVEVLSIPVAPAPGERKDSSKSFRVIVKDTVSGTKTVLVNVVPGKTYTSDNLAITVEVEKDSFPATDEVNTSKP